MKKIIKFFKTKIKKIKNSKKIKKIKAKIKEFILHITDKEYLKENIRVVILGILVLIFLVSTIVYLFLSKNISKIEEEKINNETRIYANYIEILADIKSKDLDKYIIYTLNYSKDVNGVNELNSEEINDFINNKLHKKSKTEEVNNHGINPTMNERNITYNISTNKYVLNDTKYDREAIAKKEVIYYRQKKLHKINKKKYIVTYEKYVVSDPYEMLDYFIKENSADKGKKQKDGSYTYNIVDTTPLRDYLTTGKEVYLKRFLNQNDKDIKKFAKKDGKIKVTYKINEENELEIYKIR